MGPVRSAYPGEALGHVGGAGECPVIDFDQGEASGMIQPPDGGANDACADTESGEGPLQMVRVIEDLPG